MVNRADQVESQQPIHSILEQGLPTGHGAFFVLTGLWPIFSPPSFQAVTGPKHDFWLVKTIGGLIAVVGGVVTLAGLRRRVTPEIALLAAGSSAVLAVSDIIYSTSGRIRKIYLLDALGELALITLWGIRSLRMRRPTY